MKEIVYPFPGSEIGRCGCCGHEEGAHEHFRNGTDCSVAGCTCGSYRDLFAPLAFLVFVNDALTVLRENTRPTAGQLSLLGLGVAFGPLDVQNVGGVRTITVRLPGTRKRFIVEVTRR